jgi:hypothetical protein
MGRILSTFLYTVNVIDSNDDTKVMNLENLYKSGRDIFDIIYHNTREVLRNIMRNLKSVQTVSTSEIQTEYLLITTLMHYCYTDSFVSQGASTEFWLEEFMRKVHLEHEGTHKTIR